MEAKTCKTTASRLVSCLLLLLFSLKVHAQPPPPIHEFGSLQREFKEPGRWYGSAPLWVWHAQVTETIIDSMMQEFKDKAFGGVFIHPRPGLITPYLSDEWHRLYDYTVEKGKTLGLDVWIYDENSYPSGFAGGHVPAEMPESYNQGQMLHLAKAERLPSDSSRYAVMLWKTGDGYVDITEKADDYRDSIGLYYLFEKAFYGQSPWYAGFSYVDLLADGVTEKFIEVTMRGYERHIGKAFGRTVPGVFTDEPNIEVQGRDNIRWTPDLFAKFHERWGYDLVPYLPALYEEVGDWRRIRHNYYQVLLQLFIDRWSKPWYHYTEKKKLEWTGHYWEHGWPNPNHGGDNMAMYAWHQRPAIDMLFNQFNEDSPNAQFGNIRAVKELSSVANQLGRRRTLSETYGGGGWELTLTDMKRLGDWQYALGVNTMNQHLSFMTLTGARKYDYPQTFSYHSPWWPYYTSQNRYFARLSLALSAGEQHNDIVILEPTTSAWMYSTFQSANPRREAIGKAFQAFVTTLERAQSEYDLASENIIKDHGGVHDARFVIGKRAYQTVVIPPGMENIDRTTFDVLLQYVQQGGRLLLFETLQYIDGTPAAETLDLLKKNKHVYAYEALDEQVIRDYFLQESLVFMGDSILHPQLYHHRRKLQDGQLVFISNASLAQEKAVSIQAAGKQVLYLDAETGEMSRFPASASGDFQSFDYTLPPAGSALFFVADRPLPDYPLWEPPAPLGQQVAVGQTDVTRREPNVLTLDFCDLALGDTVLRDLNVYYAADTLFKHYGFTDGNPWNTSVQYKDQTIRRDTFSLGTGFTVTYSFDVAPGVAPDGLKAVAEHSDIWEVTVNGQVVKPLPGQWWLDRDFAVFAIGTHVKAGQNTLQITTPRMRVYAEIEPVYILGDFSLKSQAKGWEIRKDEPLKLGSWKTQGMPLYGQEVSYTRSFEGKAGQPYRVKLGEWKGTAAVVKLNGIPVGAVHYPPYELELNEGVRDGMNEVEVIVVGSLKNTLGPHHGNPQPGMVSPWHWRRAKEYSPGNAYDTYDYGLMGDVEVWNIHMQER